MTVRVDSEQNEIGALLDFVDLEERRVLEIGSGDGRLTWRYADRVAHVTAVEPFAPALARAEDKLPPELAGRIVLRRAAFREFAAETAASTFDVAIFSWSLCCMDQDDMVPALEEAHRVLGSDGTVIDIHGVQVRRRSKSTAPGRSCSRSPHQPPMVRASAMQTKRSPRRSRAGCSSRNVALSSTSACTPHRCASCASSSRKPTRMRGRRGPRRATRTSPSCTGEFERIAASTTGTEVAYHERARITQLRTIVT